MCWRMASSAASGSCDSIASTRSAWESMSDGARLVGRPVGAPEAQVVLQQPVDRLLQDRVAGHPGQVRVDRVVGVQVLLDRVRGTHPVGRVGQRPEPLELRRRGPPGREVGDPALDRLARLEHVEHVGEAERGDVRAPPRHDGDEAVGGEPGDGLADRHPAEAGLGRQLLLVDDRAGRQPEVDDHVAQEGVGEVARPGLLLHVHLRTGRLLTAEHRARRPSEPSGPGGKRALALRRRRGTGSRCSPRRRRRRRCSGSGSFSACPPCQRSTRSGLAMTRRPTATASACAVGRRARSASSRVVTTPKPVLAIEARRRSGARRSCTSSPVGSACRTLR